MFHRQEDSMNSTYSGPERRNAEGHIVLTDDQIEIIAKRAADQAVEKLTDHVYRQIGKSVVSKMFWAIGVLAVAFYFYAVSHGWIKPPGT